MPKEINANENYIADFKREISTAITNFERSYKIVNSITQNDNLDKMPKEIKQYLDTLESCIITAQNSRDLWESLANTIKKLPGFWSFFSPIRPLTLSIEKILKDYSLLNVLKAESEVKDQLHKKSERKIRELEDEVCLLNERVGALKMENSILKSKHNISDQELEPYLKYEREKRRANNLQTKIDRMKEDYNNLNARCDSLEESNRILERSNRLLEENLNEEKRKAEIEKKNTKKKFADYDQKLTFVINILNKVESNNTQLQNTITRLESQNKEQFKKIEQLERNDTCRFFSNKSQISKAPSSSVLWDSGIHLNTFNRT